MSKQILMDQLGDVIGVRSTYDQDDEDWGAFVFDWDELPTEFRAAFVSDLFGDCEEGDFEDIIELVEEETDHGTLLTPTWKGRPWFPFALTNVQDDEVELSEEDGMAEYPQFDRLLLVNLDEVSDDSIPVYAIEVDGTAIPAPEPELFWKQLGADRFSPV